MSGDNRSRAGRARSALGRSASDEVLVQRVAGADRDAFEELYARLASTVYGLALCVVGDRADAEEVTQQVFMQVWSTASCFDPTWGTARTWVLTAAHREAVGTAQAGRGGRGWEGGVGGGVSEPVGAKHRADPDGPVLHGPIAALSQRQRDVLAMVHFGGLSCPEVARALHLPLSVVPVYLRDGLRHLADETPPRM